jgi:hypothetical protein
MPVQLIVEITQQEMQAVQWDGHALTFLGSVLCAKRTDIGYKESLHQLLDKLGDLDRFESYSCSYFSPIATLVPNGLFASSKPEELLQFTVQAPLTKNDVDYSRIPEWNMVLVYNLPLWVKSVLIVKLPRIVIQHELAHVLRKLGSGSTIPLRIHVCVHEEAFSCVIMKDGQIAHCSIQEYQAPEDLVYHLSLCFSELSIQSKNELFIHYGNQTIANNLNQLTHLLTKIHAFNESKIIDSLHNHLQFQTLCV